MCPSHASASSGASQISNTDSPTARRSSARISRHAWLNSSCAGSAKPLLPGAFVVDIDEAEREPSGRANISAVSGPLGSSRWALTQSAGKR
jgi:hypothetical protein